MNSRPFIWFVALLLLLGFMRHERKERRQLSDAREHVQELESQMTQLQDSVQELTSATDSFDSEDWRQVVPNVRDAARDVESQAEQTASGVEDVSDSLSN